MKIISKGLGEGKTTDLVRIMLQPGNEDVVFVAPTWAQAERIGYRTAISFFGATPGKELQGRFISASALENHVRTGKHRYVFDEVDGVLQALLRAPVIAIAGTDEDVRHEYLVSRGHVK